MSGHTPGPWVTRFSETKAYSGFPSSGICTIENARQTHVIAHLVTAEVEDEGNAYVIAAAPELLAACRLAEDYVTHAPNAPLANRLALRRRALNVLSAVIMKAEGAQKGLQK